jgi:hypothetical protein
MKSKLILFILFSFLFFAQSKAQDSKIGFEINTYYDGVFFTNQPSKYLAPSVEKRLNTSLDALHSLNVIVPLKDSKNNLKIGLGYSDQDYSFDNNPPSFLPIIVFGSSSTPKFINNVYVRTGFITVPIAFEREISKKSKKKSLKFTVGLNTNFNISKSSEVGFSNGFPVFPDDPFDIEEYESEIKIYYLESVRKVTFKALSSIGYDFLLAKKLHLLLDTRVGFYLQSFNPRVMNVPIIVGIGAGLKYDL